MCANTLADVLAKLAGVGVQRGPVGELVVARRVGRPVLLARDAAHHPARDERVLGVRQATRDAAYAAWRPTDTVDEFLGDAFGGEALLRVARGGAEAHRHEPRRYRSETIGVRPHERLGASLVRARVQ